MSASRNIALIGCGYWGRNLARILAEKSALVGIADPSPQASALAAQYGVEHWPDSKAALARTDIAAVMIATPAETHYRFACDALWADKDVFVEKPIALDSRDATELAALAASKDRILMVGHLLQYHNGFLRLKQMVDDGELGQLRYIYSNRLNMGKLRREENVLWSFAPHDFSMILALAGGLPEQVTASGAAYLHPKIADTTMTHMAFSTGLRAHIYVSWLHPMKEQRLVVIGEKGMLVFDDTRDWDDKLTLYRHAVEWQQGAPVASKADAEAVALVKAEPLSAEVDHFLDCVAQRCAPRTDAQEAICVLRALNSAQRSMETGLPVRLDPAAQEGAVNAAKDQYFAHETVAIDPGAAIGAGTKIWHFSHILGNSRIGRDCVIGQNCAIGPDVTIGDGCKFQNNVSVYKGVTIEDDVFCGPSIVFTNVLNPRAHVERKDEFAATIVRKGATLGANATIVCGNEIGAYAMVGAGAVVTRSVPDHALVVGNPARQIGWVSHAGERLGEDLVCPRSGDSYRLSDKGLVRDAASQPVRNAAKTAR